MKVAVIGGKLQGVEAVYLAKQAGWEVLLIDKNHDVPAAGLAHSFLQADVTYAESDIQDILQDRDLIIPALEDAQVLESLNSMAKRKGLPLAYDERAYEVTSSKFRSGMLFEDLNLPTPRPWPECGFPLILKPSDLSGSRGVRKIENAAQLDSLRQKEGRDNEGTIIQEYCQGPSYSLEIIGDGENFLPLQPTTIEVDGSYDCKRVTAPAGLSKSLAAKFDEIALDIASALGLRGIMDIEVILHQNELKVLEIDARLPSQTPTVVLKSTGINMLELIYEIFAGKTLPEISPVRKEKAVIYEHIHVHSDRLEIMGEHIMSRARSLNNRTDFFGADEALTDFDPDRTDWVATLIMMGGTMEKAARKHRQVLERICETFGLKECFDPEPE